jgi:hypothetical protein
MRKRNANGWMPGFQARLSAQRRSSSIKRAAPLAFAALMTPAIFSANVGLLATLMLGKTDSAR